MILQEELAKSVHQKLHIYLQQMQEVLNILEEERKSLIQRDFVRFQEILLHKTNLLDEIAEFDKAVNKLLKPLLKRNTNIESVFATYQGALAQTLRLQWQGIQNTGRACQRANEINSKIVAHSQQHYARLMAILRNQDPNESTYGKQGYKTKGSSQQRLAQA